MPSETLTWPEVSSRLAAARHYWLGSTMPSGSPHAGPVWGVVTGETLYLYSERGTVKAPGGTPPQPRMMRCLALAVTGMR